MIKAPKEFHNELDQLYDQIYKDREHSNNFGIAKTKKRKCTTAIKIIPFKMPFESIYSSYIIKLEESKIVN